MFKFTNPDDLVLKWFILYVTEEEIMTHALTLRKGVALRNKGKYYYVLKTSVESTLTAHQYE
jgi:hypothetical protein